MKQNLASFTLTPTPSWGTAPKVRIWDDQQNQASTGEVHPAGNETENYRVITLEANGAGWDFPTTEFDSTDDSSDPNATRSAAVFNGTKNVYSLFDRWVFRASMGTTFGYDTLEAENVTRVPLRDDTAYSKVQTDLRIQSAIDNLVLPLADSLEHYAREYVSLSAAVAALGSTVTTLVVDDVQAITASLTIPSTLGLRFTAGGQVTVSAGQTLTINGPFTSPAKRIFYGSGVVRFTSNTTMKDFTPQWWGVTGDGVTNDATTLQACVDAVPDRSRIIFSTNCHVALGATLNIVDREGLELIGPTWAIGGTGGRPAAQFIWIGSAGGTMVSLNKARHCRISSFAWTPNTANVAIDIDGYASGHICTQNEIDHNYINNSGQNNPSFVGIRIAETVTNNVEFMYLHHNAIICGSQISRKRGNDDGIINIGVDASLLTSASAAFIAGDVGQVVRVAGAGVAGATLETTIATRISATQVTLTAPASTSVTGARIHIGKGVGIGIKVGPSPNSKNHIFEHNTVQQALYGVKLEAGSMYVSDYSGGYGEYDFYITGATEPVILRNISTEGAKTAVYVSAGTAPVTLVDSRMSNTEQLTEGYIQFGPSIRSFVFENNNIEVAPPAGGRILDGRAASNLNLISKSNMFFAQGSGLTLAEAGFTSIPANLGWISINDAGVKSLGGVVSRPWGAGSQAFAVPGSTGFPRSAMGTVADSTNALGVYGLESVTEADTLKIGDGELEISGVARPRPPRLLIFGTGGSASYPISIVAVDSAGRRTLRSYPTATASANATLSATDYVQVDWAAVPGAASYEVYMGNPLNSGEIRLIASGVLTNSYQITSNPVGAYVAINTVTPTQMETTTIKFRAPISQAVTITFADGDTTPSVKKSNHFKTANTGATTITTFDDGVEGQEIFILFTDANTTLSDAGALKLSAAFSSTADDTMTLVKIGSNWYEKCRSVN